MEMVKPKLKETSEDQILGHCNLCGDIITVFDRYFETDGNHKNVFSCPDCSNEMHIEEIEDPLDKDGMSHLAGIPTVGGYWFLLKEGRGWIKTSCDSDIDHYNILKKVRMLYWGKHKERVESIIYGPYRYMFRTDLSDFIMEKLKNERSRLLIETDYISLGIELLEKKLNRNE